VKQTTQLFTCSITCFTTFEITTACTIFQR